MLKIILSVFLLFTSSFSFAQAIKGRVNYIMEDGMLMPLADANVQWMGIQKGTSTKEDGTFELLPSDSSRKIIISYTGYQNDTLVASDSFIEVTLSKAITLHNVNVKGQRSSSYISSLSTAKSEIITSDELTKAACCNLSESFITNASIDVTYSDAISGAKQITLLGLAGKYSQIMTDVLPSVRGLDVNDGFSFIPGPWVSSINLNKGAGSVVNGFESISGQIDIELKKPENSEKLFVYLYGNSFARFEGNIYASHKINQHWSTMLFAHGNFNELKVDNNHDGFLDFPLNEQGSGLFRWKYDSQKGFQTMFGFSYLYNHSLGGQTTFNPGNDIDTLNAYGVNLTTNRYQLFDKMWYTWPGKPYQSIGLQLEGINHIHEGYFGLKNYSANELFGYANLIYQSIIHDSKNQFKTGLSWFYDKVNETLDLTTQQHRQKTPGAFFEYSYDDLKHLSAVAGIRADADLNNKVYVTPRLHLQYKFNENNSLRASAGSGWRYANAIAENEGFLASSRKIVFSDTLKPEQAWNYGINFTRHFYIKALPFAFSVDVYRTDFINQLIADADANPQELIFSNLDGKSYANSLQAELNFNPIPQLQIKVAYKYYDVKETYHSTLLEKPFTPKNRGLLSATYNSANDHWQISGTVQYVGSQRLPSTLQNPKEFQALQTSPDYLQLFAQVNYSLKEWQFFMGGENLGNFTQEDRIIDAQNPFGSYFDASLIWGPVSTRTIYAGLRFEIK